MNSLARLFSASSRPFLAPVSQMVSVAATGAALGVAVQVYANAVSEREGQGEGKERTTTTMAATARVHRRSHFSPINSPLLSLFALHNPRSESSLRSTSPGSTSPGAPRARRGPGRSSRGPRRPARRSTPRSPRGPQPTALPPRGGAELRESAGGGQMRAYVPLCRAEVNVNRRKQHRGRRAL